MVRAMGRALEGARRQSRVIPVASSSRRVRLAAAARCANQTDAAHFLATGAGCPTNFPFTPPPQRSIQTPRQPLPQSTMPFIFPMRGSERQGAVFSAAETSAAIGTRGQRRGSGACHQHRLGRRSAQPDLRELLLRTVKGRSASPDSRRRRSSRPAPYQRQLYRPALSTPT